MFVAVCLGVFCLTFWPIVRSVISARRFASEMGPGEVRLLGACRSKRFGIRSGFPVVVLEVGSSDSRFVASVGRRSQSHVVATCELRFKWNGTILICVEHDASSTKLWPRWTPVDPSTLLPSGQATLS